MMFFKDNTGIILLSIILGLGFASLFKKVCQSDACKIVQYRLPKNVKDDVAYHENDKCYKLVKQKTSCGTRKPEGT